MGDLIEYLSAVKDVATIVLASLKLFDVLGVNPCKEVTKENKKA